ncbi:MAG: hypothetical protein ACFFAH_01490 [Promethearchaeota archaeon]
MSLQEKIKKAIKGKQYELKNIDNIFRQKELQIEKQVVNDFKLMLKKLESDLSHAHRELTDINTKLNRDLKRVNHINLGDLKLKKSEVNITIRHLSKKIKSINKERAKVLKDKLRELLKEKKGKIKQLNLDLEKLSQRLASEETVSNN